MWNGFRERSRLTFEMCIPTTDNLMNNGFKKPVMSYRADLIHAWFSKCISKI